MTSLRYFGRIISTQWLRQTSVSQVHVEAEPAERILQENRIRAGETKTNGQVDIESSTVRGRLITPVHSKREDI